jgi:1,4-dihydroxy-6-naphthoate synthase
MKVNQLIKKSIKFAWARPEVSFPFVKSHAKELSETVIKRHIDLYVNDFSLELGKEGEKAIRFLFEKGRDAGLFEIDNSDLFV